MIILNFISFNILLNNNTEFQGGGTYFNDGLTINPNQGDLIIHSKSKYKDTNAIERNSFLFGVKEIKNRIIFVQKNKLSIKNFILGYFFFIIKNFFNSFSDIKKIMRFIGNIIGAYYLIKLK